MTRTSISDGSPVCGRYTLTHDPRRIEERLQLHIPGGEERWNIAPSQEVLAVVNGDGGREARLLRWGLVPRWAKDLCQPLPEGRLTARPANPLVNRAGGEEGPHLLQVDNDEEAPVTGSLWS